EKDLIHWPDGNLTETVIPQKGYTISLIWGDTGTKLVAAGGIDMEKYIKNYFSCKQFWRALSIFCLESFKLNFISMTPTISILIISPEDILFNISSEIEDPNSV
ncbi:MAG: hypothetical protein ACWGOX_14975, partial [Desulforhopalus sp.]